MKFLSYDFTGDTPPVYVAEISANHDNTLEGVFKLIESAKDANADAVKVQMYNSEELTSQRNQKKVKWLGNYVDPKIIYGNNDIVWDNIKVIWDYAAAIKIPIFASVYGYKGLEKLHAIGCKAYKIASYENDWFEFIDDVISTREAVLISTGLKDSYREYPDVLKGDLGRVCLLHCVSSYPCLMHNAHLRRITELQDFWGDEVGYSDHTVGSKCAEYASVLGVKLIEKHLTVNHRSIDGLFSASVDSFRNMVSHCNQAWRAQFGNDTCEDEAALWCRSIWVVADIKKGEEFTEDNIKILRPWGELEPRSYKYLLGKKASMDIEAGVAMAMEFADGR